jgi:glycosyltransferase involved in cell wall biosynthesis
LRRNGISAEPLPLPVPAPDADFVRSPAREPLFVYCGRLNREKGVDLLLRAFARVLELRPRARLRIVGDGPRRPQLEGFASQLGRRAVRFEGRVSFAGVEAAFRDAWALVAPSLWAEPLGLVAIEAITRGLPAIASARGGFAETIVDGVSGRLVRNGDEQALVDSLVATIDRGPSTVPEHAVRALRRRHDVEEHNSRLIALFREIDNERRRVEVSRET